ncbi:hypothetical protein CALVIDRAFT_599429 [Calocera viscosa TUFC12733]|uniref:Nephrocystin 3-like N-terminal domain-containing protein n=1 Tax=Calocera viscosa (strain TUFC12733) TaxID=1330018 RepID=A0A167FKA6_CALVF|nr:hypothetical protein CALVIDRAFT_603553 [Calocera viscosa TUFC12733]KZO94949.1 hypothetical protein CALVIDRAFT_599429 [Calocera viscosa TUFC12733]
MSHSKRPSVMTRPTATTITKAKQVFGRFKKSAIDAPAKLLLDTAVQFVGLIKTLDENGKAWKDFAKHVGDSITCIVRVPDKTLLTPTMQEHLERLLSTLTQMLTEARTYGTEGTARQLVLHGGSERAVSEMRKKFDEALMIFNLQLMLVNGVEIAKVRATLNDMQQFSSAASSNPGGGQIPLQEPLSNEIKALPYGRGMSWDPEKMCLPGTRVELLDEIWDWINAPLDGHGAKVFWLVDVAGSGKTTVAHTISNKASKAGNLLLSYFLSRDDSLNSTASMFVTTLATHMARQDLEVARRMAEMLHADPSLRSAPVARQFGSLIIDSQTRNDHDDDGTKGSKVIIVDALDECADHGEAVVRTLLSDVQQFSSNIRILVTSRPLPEIRDALEPLAQVIKREMGLSTDMNKRDLRYYVSHRLPGIMRKLQKSGDHEHIQRLLSDRAEGLFLWASTVTGFLERCLNPDRHLEALSLHKDESKAERHMDSLYEMILSDCPWDDDDFCEGYQRYVGFLLVARKPVRYSVLHQLNPDVAVSPEAVFGRLSSLLKDHPMHYEEFPMLHSDIRTVRVIHSSFRAYLLNRAPPPYCFNIYLLETQLDVLYGYLSRTEQWAAALAGWGDERITVEKVVALLAEVIPTSRLRFYFDCP